MAYVKNFQHDVFISYAHADNEADNWVDQFVQQLQCAVKQRLGGTAPTIFYDAQSFHANHQLEDLLQAAQNSALFLAIASRSYAVRPWTQQELEGFCKTDPDLHRLFAVECMPLDEPDTYPHPLDTHKRLQLWRSNEPASKTPIPLNPGSELFKACINDLAEDIKNQLKALNSKAEAILPPTNPEPLGKSVLLAQVTDDLEEEREQVRRYLEQFNITVLPKDSYPQGGNEFKTAFNNDLSIADFFVQLLGPKQGRTPSDFPEGYTRFQHSQALKAKKQLMQWRHPELLLDKVQNPDYLNLLTAETVMASTLESFKAEIVRRCQLPVKPVKNTHPSALPLVFINADPEDSSIAETLQKQIRQQKFPVCAPMFNSPPEEFRENLEENLTECEVLIWVYGNVKPNWVQRQLKYFNKLKHRRNEEPLLLAVCLGTPPEPPESKPDICMDYPDLREIDCRYEAGFAELNAMMEGLRT